mmetsp:Transcript_119065/g.273037  ORF Transcript_119065/g.273037 Transcript_119065/m.273037 type:complete len:744 (+) Transcript_119065:26-2257(+)
MAGSSVNPAVFRIFLAMEPAMSEDRPRIESRGSALQGSGYSLDGSLAFRDRGYAATTASQLSRRDVEECIFAAADQVAISKLVAIRELDPVPLEVEAICVAALTLIWHIDGNNMRSGNPDWGTVVHTLGVSGGPGRFVEAMRRYPSAMDEGVVPAESAEVARSLLRRHVPVKKDSWPDGVASLLSWTQAALELWEFPARGGNAEAPATRGQPKGVASDTEARMRASLRALSEMGWDVGPLEDPSRSTEAACVAVLLLLSWDQGIEQRIGGAELTWQSWVKLIMSNDGTSVVAGAMKRFATALSQGAVPASSVDAAVRLIKQPSDQDDPEGAQLIRDWACAALQLADVQRSPPETEAQQVSVPPLRSFEPLSRSQQRPDKGARRGQPGLGQSRGVTTPVKQGSARKSSARSAASPPLSAGSTRPSTGILSASSPDRAARARQPAKAAQAGRPATKATLRRVSPKPQQAEEPKVQRPPGAGIPDRPTATSMSLRRSAGRKEPPPPPGPLKPHLQSPRRAPLAAAAATSAVPQGPRGLTFSQSKPELAVPNNDPEVGAARKEIAALKGLQSKLQWTMTRQDRARKALTASQSVQEITTWRQQQMAEFAEVAAEREVAGKEDCLEQGRVSIEYKRGKKRVAKAEDLELTTAQYKDKMNNSEWEEYFAAMQVENLHAVTEARATDMEALRAAKMSAEYWNRQQEDYDRQTEISAKNVFRRQQIQAQRDALAASLESIELASRAPIRLV